MKITLKELKDLVLKEVWSLGEHDLVTRGEKVLSSLKGGDLKQAMQDLHVMSSMFDVAYRGEAGPGEREFMAVLGAVNGMLRSGDLKDLPRAVEVTKMGLASLDEGWADVLVSEEEGPSEEDRWRDQEEHGDYLSRSRG